jgi:hypothetical protein
MGMKNIKIILLLGVILLGCRKSKDNSVSLSTVLTDCPVNTSCTYNYFDRAGITAVNQLVAGGDRVFWYKSVNSTLCNMTNELNFKASLNSNSFVINSNAIATGLVAYNQSCVCCDFILLKPIGGEIKGKRTDVNQWLINATVILGDHNNKPFDILKVNQYFTLKAQ